MMGKYKRMKSTNPINCGVVMPALSGRVFCMRRKSGESAFRMMTKAMPPKYICTEVQESATILAVYRRTASLIPGTRPRSGLGGALATYLCAVEDERLKDTEGDHKI